MIHFIIVIHFELKNNPPGIILLSFASLNLYLLIEGSNLQDNLSPVLFYKANPKIFEADHHSHLLFEVHRIYYHHVRKVFD